MKPYLVEAALAATLLGCSQIIDAGDATYTAAAPVRRPAPLQQADAFGNALALWDDELIVAAPGGDLTDVVSNRGDSCGARVDADQTGRVFAFTLGADDWIDTPHEIERDRADDSDGLANFFVVYDQPLMALARSGDVLAVGWPGMDYSDCAVGREGDEQIKNAGGVYLYERGEDGRFEQVAFLTSKHPVADGVFGGALALSGTRLFVGAPGEDNESQGEEAGPKAGRVYVYERNGPESWSELDPLVPANPLTNASFGNALAADGDTVAVGALFDSHPARGVNPEPIAGLDALQSGAAYVFRRQGEHYEQEAFIKAENADANDAFGASVALEGDTLVVGAMVESAATQQPFATGDELRAAADNELLGAGAVYVYRRSAEQWTFDAYLKAPEPQAGAAFGNALALHDGRLVVGALTEGVDQIDTNAQYDEGGAAYLYDSIGPDVTPQVFRPSPSDKRALHGYAVALGSRWLVIGGPAAGGGRGDVSVFEIEP